MTTTNKIIEGLQKPTWSYPKEAEATFIEQYLDRVVPAVNELMDQSQPKHGPGVAERPLTQQVRSALNHIGLWKAGYNYDDESLGHHLIAAICNLAVMYQHTVTKPYLDDRPKRYSMGDEVKGMVKV